MHYTSDNDNTDTRGTPVTPSRDRCNTWQGEFPHEDNGTDGCKGRCSVRDHPYPPNGYGLHHITGNVWEWTQDWWTTHHNLQGVGFKHRAVTDSFEIDTVPLIKIFLDKYKNEMLLELVVVGKLFSFFSCFQVHVML